VAVGALVGGLAGYGIPRLHVNPAAKAIDKGAASAEREPAVRFALAPAFLPEPGLASFVIARFGN
jgi:hypothetical protein